MLIKGLIKLVEISGTQKYVDEVLPEILHKIMRRRCTRGLIDEIKLFTNSKKFIFEQDHASVHDANYTQNHLRETLSSTNNVLE